MAPVRALVIGNADDFDPGFVGHRLREHGYAFTECHREHPDRWPALDGHELVLTLGSEWNVYRPETAELVEAEAALVRRVVAADVPLLGICFGAQVLAHAFGGTVSRTPDAGDRLVRRRRSTNRRSPPGRGCSGTSTCSPSPTASPSSAARRSDRR